MAKILIIEDDQAINNLIFMNLDLVGYDCKQVFDGKEASEVIYSWQPDLILLDVMIPYVDGFTLIEQNKFSTIPVIFVTAKDNISFKVKGLQLGADDYIVKPFESIELLARIEAVLRRTKPVKRRYSIGSTIIDLDEHITIVKNEPVSLTNQEFVLLEALINNCNLALSREQLLNLAWGQDYFGDARTVDVHITKLRKKLQLESYIQTVYKFGYRLEFQK
ncbi:MULTISPECIES: response regulator transcription factor [Bacillaceae]|nr:MULTISPECIES: response regulator transcription factor [Bacillaceae]MCE4051928.1 response regulator transcription factor [Bacillus sp. Au-Bac7]MDL0437539.1 response regulator transcription factor [Niallia sp. SS-2023]UPO87968.1 response regulator transcription factor [Niallia sp. Man26]